MYNVTLHYDNQEISKASHVMFSEAASIAVDQMPAMYMVVAQEIELRAAKGSEYLFAVPLQAHLEVA